MPFHFISLILNSHKILNCILKLLFDPWLELISVYKHSVGTHDYSTAHDVIFETKSCGVIAIMTIVN